MKIFIKQCVVLSTLFLMNNVRAQNKQGRPNIIKPMGWEKQASIIGNQVRYDSLYHFTKLVWFQGYQFVPWQTEWYYGVLFYIPKNKIVDSVKEDMFKNPKKYGIKFITDSGLWYDIEPRYNKIFEQLGSDSLQKVALLMNLRYTKEIPLEEADEISDMKPMFTVVTYPCVVEEYWYVASKKIWQYQATKTFNSDTAIENYLLKKYTTDQLK